MVSLEPISSCVMRVKKVTLENCFSDQTCIPQVLAPSHAVAPSDGDSTLSFHAPFPLTPSVSQKEAGPVCYAASPGGLLMILPYHIEEIIQSVQKLSK